MGQAKLRGTREERVTAAVAREEERTREARIRREMDERALARMDAANKRQLKVNREPGDVVLVTHSSKERIERLRPNNVALALALGGMFSRFYNRA